MNQFWSDNIVCSGWSNRLGHTICCTLYSALYNQCSFFFNVWGRTRTCYSTIFRRSICQLVFWVVDTVKPVNPVSFTAHITSQVNNKHNKILTAAWLSVIVNNSTFRADTEEFHKQLLVLNIKNRQIWVIPLNFIVWVA